MTWVGGSVVGSHHIPQFEEYTRKIVYQYWVTLIPSLKYFLKLLWSGLICPLIVVKISYILGLICVTAKLGKCHLWEHSYNYGLLLRTDTSSRQSTDDMEILKLYLYQASWVVAMLSLESCNYCRATGILERKRSGHFNRKHRQIEEMFKR